MSQLSQLSHHLPADSVDVQLCYESDDAELDEDDADGCLQYFVSSAAANTPLMGPMLAGQPAGGGLETTVGDDSALSCNAVVDFTCVISPSKVSCIYATVLRASL